MKLLEMGAQSSKNSQFGSKIFSDSENKHLEIVFSNIAGENKHAFSEQQLKEFLLSTHLAHVSNHLFGYMLSHQNEHNSNSSMHGQRSRSLVTSCGFLTALAHALKGSVDQVAALTVFLASGQGDCCRLDQLEKLMSQLAKILCTTASAASVWKGVSEKSMDAFVRQLLFDLVYKGNCLQCDVTDPLAMDTVCTLTDVENWFLCSAVSQEIVRHSFHRLFLSEYVGNLPSLVPVSPQLSVGHSSAFVESALLDSAAALFLCQHVPHDLRRVFRPLFSSAKHGESFSAFLRNTMNQGPCVIIVQDTDGYIFGGYASESWTIRPQFYVPDSENTPAPALNQNKTDVLNLKFVESRVKCLFGGSCSDAAMSGDVVCCMGSLQCFLFTLFPIMEVYFPSGLNTNYMYLNQGQQTLPNGLGMGGQLDYFGFWLDNEYGTGHSRAQPKCTTYKSPQLSSKPKFTVRTIEVWAVGAIKQSEEVLDGDDQKKKSILDKVSADTKAILKMAGKSSASDALREADNM